MRASTPSSGATVRPTIKAPSGRSTRRTSATNCRQSPHAAEHLDQQHGVERSRRRTAAAAPSACTSRGRCARSARANARSMPNERSTPDIVVAGRDERPADPAGAGAEIEHARARAAAASSTAARIASATPSGNARSRSKRGASASIGRCSHAHTRRSIPRTPSLMLRRPAVSFGVRRAGTRPHTEHHAAILMHQDVTVQHIQAGVVHEAAAHLEVTRDDVRSGCRRAWARAPGRDREHVPPDQAAVGGRDTSPAGLPVLGLFGSSTHWRRIGLAADRADVVRNRHVLPFTGRRSAARCADRSRSRSDRTPR